MKLASLNFHDSASTALIDDYHKTLLDMVRYYKLLKISFWKTAGLG